MTLNSLEFASTEYNNQQLFEDSTAHNTVQLSNGNLAVVWYEQGLVPVGVTAQTPAGQIKMRIFRPDGTSTDEILVNQYAGEGDGQQNLHFTGTGSSG